jgi:L-cysteine desulfidase
MYTIKDILRIEVAPALGCTEPAAVALCTAAAGSLLSDKTLKSLDLWLSPSIYKNAFAVAIPGTQGQVGIDLAAALGVYGGDPRQKLQVLAPLNADHIAAAHQLIRKDGVHIHLLEKTAGIYIRTKLTGPNETAEAVIETTHDNLVSLRHNDQPVTGSNLLSNLANAHSELEELEQFLCEQTLEDLLVLVKQLDDEDLAFLREGIQYNLDLAEHGMDFGCGLGVGKTLERLAREGLLKKDMVLDARILSSSACDARMSGAKLPAMSSAGSGNHGLTAILPVWAVSKYLSDVNETDILKAIALSHVVTGYIKSHTGRLSAACGCSIAAGAGATAGIAYLMGGNLKHIAGAIKNLLGDLAGVICDGAKAGCSLKLATAAGTAVQSALFSLHGIDVKETDGIVAGTPEQTMKNMGQISTQGMIDTDQTILQIMIEKKLTDRCLQCPQK